MDTGGGILNMINNSQENDFIIFNPDTLWSKKYLSEIKKMIDIYINKKLNNILLLVNKELSFDKNLNGDFGIENHLINMNKKNFIYTGCQILNRSIFDNKKTQFPVNDVWTDLIKSKQLNGLESKIKFFHVTNLDIFKKLEDL